MTRRFVAVAGERDMLPVWIGLVLQPLRSIKVKNFRSLAEADIELSSFSVLIGPNGSGKSNLVNRLEPEEIIICDRDPDTGESLIPAISAEEIAQAVRGGSWRAGELWFTGCWAEFLGDAEKGAAAIPSRTSAPHGQGQQAQHGGGHVHAGPDDRAHGPGRGQG